MIWEFQRCYSIAQRTKLLRFQATRQLYRATVVGIGRAGCMSRKASYHVIESFLHTVMQLLIVDRYTTTEYKDTNSLGVLG